MRTTSLIKQFIVVRFRLRRKFCDNVAPLFGAKKKPTLIVGDLGNESGAPPLNLHVPVVCVGNTQDGFGCDSVGVLKYSLTKPVVQTHKNGSRGLCSVYWPVERVVKKTTVSRESSVHDLTSMFASGI